MSGQRQVFNVHSQNYRDRGPRHQNNNYGRGGRHSNQGYNLGGTGGYNEGRRIHDNNQFKRKLGEEGDEPLDRNPTSLTQILDKPLGTVRYGSRTTGAPRKPASMIEHVEDPLPKPVTEVKQILAGLGDLSAEGTMRELTDNIKGFVAVLLSKNDLAEHGAALAELFVNCMVTLPVQSPIIATVLALLHHADVSEALLDNNVLPFVHLVVARLGERIVTAAAEGDVTLAKIGLRSVASLASSSSLALDGPGGLLECMGCLLDIAYASWSVSSGVGAITLNHEGQVATFLVASTLPWAASLLSAPTAPAAASSLLSRCAAQCARVVAEWHSPFNIGGKQAVFHVNTVPVDDEEVQKLSSGPSGVPCWDTLWEACNLAMEVTKLCAQPGGFLAPRCMPSPWVELEADLTAQSRSSLVLVGHFSASIRELHSQNKFFPQLRSSGLALKATMGALLDAHAEGSLAGPWLRPVFNIFDSASTPQSATLCTRLSLIEKVVVAGYYRDILHVFEPYLRRDGTRVGSVELLSNQLLSVSNIFSDSADFELEYLLVETLLQLIVQLPVNPLSNALIFRVILELCKKASVPSIVALGSSIVFQTVTEMDVTAWRELARWLAFHLVNTKLQWPYWQFWLEEYQSAPLDGAVRGFIESVLDHCSRAVIAEELSSALPAELRHLVKTAHTFVPSCSLCAGLSESTTETTSAGAPAVTEVASSDDSDPALRVAVAELHALVEQKCEADAVEEWLDAPREVLPAHSDETDDEMWRLRAIVQVIFFVSRGTLSSITSLIERYLDPIRILADSSNAQKSMIGFIAEVVSNDTGMLRLTLDILIRRGAIAAAAAVDWLSAADSPTTFARRLVSDHHLFGVIEEAVDRGLDMLRASLQHQKRVGPVMAAAGPINDSDDHALVIGRTMDGDEDLDKDESDGRRGASLVAITAVGMDEEEAEADPAAVAADAVASALGGCRKAYALLVSRSLEALAARASAAIAEGDEDTGYTGGEVAALSLLMRVLRSFHGADAFLRAEGGLESPLLGTAQEEAASLVEKEGVSLSHDRLLVVTAAAWRSF